MFHWINQVNNRDISIAVLRTFISKRQQEHENFLSRKAKSSQKIATKDADESVVDDESKEHSNGDEKSNGDSKLPCETSQDEPCTSHEEKATKTTEANGHQLKSPRVLEVFLILIFYSSIYLLEFRQNVIRLLIDKDLIIYGWILQLKALSASGLRALRYAREIEGIGQVVALDNDKGSLFVNC